MTRTSWYLAITLIVLALLVSITVSGDDVTAAPTVVATGFAPTLASVPITDTGLYTLSLELATFTPTPTPTNTPTPSPTPTPTQPSQLAFPGAVGYGRNTIGGRGGAVLFVTNCNNSGAGSWRAALAANGPRTIVPRVACKLAIDSQLTINTPYFTIAGQAAPGGGTVITSSPLNMDGCINIRTDQGIVAGVTCAPGKGGTTLTGPRQGDAVDAFATCCGAGTPTRRNIIFVNLSGYFSVDEILDFANTVYATAQDSIFAWPYDHSTHSYTAANPNIGHSKIALIGYGGGSNISVYGNILCHFVDRAPEAHIDGNVQFAANLVCNWGTVDSTFGGRQWVSHYTPLWGDMQVDHLDNMYVSGLDSDPVWMAPDGRHRILTNWNAGGNPFPNDGNPGDTMTFYLEGNRDVDLGDIATVHNNTPLSVTLNYTTTPQGIDLPDTDAYNATFTALGEMGAGMSWGVDCAGKRYARKPFLDTLLKRGIWDRNGRILNDVTDLLPNGFADIVVETGPACTDSDSDGMPDVFEVNHGTNAGLFDAWGNVDGDEWLNLEEYIWGIGE